MRLTHHENLKPDVDWVLLLLFSYAPDGPRLIREIPEPPGLEAPRGGCLSSGAQSWDEDAVSLMPSKWAADGCHRQLEAGRPDALEEALGLARLQKRLGLPISVNATASTYGFFDGSESTAHIDADGRPFFDTSFPTERKMGCPFGIDHRIPEMTARIRSALEAYRKESLPIDFLYADWEVDGPLEWNGAWESSKKCQRCRREVSDIESFDSFQRAIRGKRAALQRAMLTDPVLEAFPDALVGNYAVYPHDGFRYWYDYFEEERDQKYRKWYPEFEETGFTFAMPVVYPWYRGYKWYDFEDSDYRWFYNMLLVGTNAGKATPPSIPIITFVHWHTTEPPRSPDPSVRQLSAVKYKELLWHLLLRGHDGLFLWSPKNEALEESQLVHSVFRESHAYREFLLAGTPLEFSVPDEPGPVVSALKLGERLLVRRTDFGPETEPVLLRVDDSEILVPRLEGRCQILELPGN
jgi:hypothetical protein